MPRNRSKIQDALRQRKQNESAAILDQAQAEEAAYQCFFQRDVVPSPIESGVTCILKLAKLSVFPNHEEYFPLYTGERLADMVESIRQIRRPDAYSGLENRAGKVHHHQRAQSGQRLHHSGTGHHPSCCPNRFDKGKR